MDVDVKTCGLSEFKQYGGTEFKVSTKKYDSAIELILMLDEFRFFTEKYKNSKFVNSHLVKNFNDILNKRYKTNTKNFSHEKGEIKHLLKPSTK